MEIYEIDSKILSILMKDANRPYTKIAKEVYVSGGTVHVRMKKMNIYSSQSPYRFTHSIPSAET